MSTAVLLSGGLDSAVLARRRSGARRGAADLRQRRPRVGSGRARDRRRAFSRARALGGRVRPLVSLGVDMRDVYAATHWAMQGRPPAYHTPDEDVYLPGRNVVLLGKAAVYCAAAKIDRLVIGTLAHNPFPDATPEFRAAMARALSLGLDRPLQIDAPYANTEKAEVIRRGAALGVPVRADAVVHESAASRGSRSRSPQPSTAASAASAASGTTRSSRPASPIRPATPAPPISADRSCVDSPPRGGVSCAREVGDFPRRLVLATRRPLHRARRRPTSTRCWRASANGSPTTTSAPRASSASRRRSCSRSAATSARAGSRGPPSPSCASSRIWPTATAPRRPPRSSAQIVKVNGKPPREKDKKDRAGCTDPNPLSTEPLAFLLPANREGYTLQRRRVRQGQGSRRADHRVHRRANRRRRASSPRTSAAIEDCFNVSIPAATRGRIWVDADDAIRCCASSSTWPGSATSSVRVRRCSGSTTCRTS